MQEIDLPLPAELALSMREHWFAPHTAYTIAKYGMSMCTLGHAGEFRPLGIAVNSLWPRTAIKPAALQMIPGVDVAACRTPEILAAKHGPCLGTLRLGTLHDDEAEPP